MLFVDIKPAPDGEGFCLHHGSGSPVWFSEIHHAISYGQDVFPRATIRIFEGDEVVSRVLKPDE